MKTKLIHEGEYLALVDVEHIAKDDDWSPYFSLDDAYKLDNVRKALCDGDLKTAAMLARIYKLAPMTI